MVALLEHLEGLSLDAEDGLVFWLHYRLGASALLTASCLLNARQFFGDPIDCISEGPTSRIIDVFCWMHSDFTVQRPLYQWSWLVFAIQAALLYLPRFLWKILRFRDPLGLANRGDGEEDEILRRAADNISCRVLTLRWNASWLVICEALNLVSVAGQVAMLGRFLDGGFWSHGWTSTQTLFPHITTCSISLFGPSGTLQTFDGLCLLPLNVVARHVFLFVWFWYFFLAACSTCHLIFRMSTVCSTRARAILLGQSCSYQTEPAARLVATKASFGQWLQVYTLRTRLEVRHFERLLKTLAGAMTTSSFDDTCAIVIEI